MRFSSTWIWHASGRSIDSRLWLCSMMLRSIIVKQITHFDSVLRERPEDCWVSFAVLRLFWATA